MPVYYFDMFDGHLSIDDEGHEFEDLEAAVRELRHALPTILADESGDRNDVLCRIEVRDAAGNRVATGTLSMTIERA